VLKRIAWRMLRSILPTLIGAWWAKTQTNPAVLVLAPALPAIGKAIRELLTRSGHPEYGNYVPF